MNNQQLNSASSAICSRINEFMRANVEGYDGIHTVESYELNSLDHVQEGIQPDVESFNNNFLLS